MEFLNSALATNCPMYCLTFLKVAILELHNNFVSRKLAHRPLAYGFKSLQVVAEQLLPNLELEMKTYLRIQLQKIEECLP
jgi:hypothetical protein